MSSFSENVSYFIYLKSNLCNEIARNICQLVLNAKMRITRFPTTTFGYSSSLPVLKYSLLLEVGGWVIKLTLRHFYFLIPFPLLFIILSLIHNLLFHHFSKWLMLGQIKDLLFPGPRKTKSDPKPDFWHILVPLSIKK